MPPLKEVENSHITITLDDLRRQLATLGLLGAGACLGASCVATAVFGLDRLGLNVLDSSAENNGNEPTPITTPALPGSQGPEISFGPTTTPALKIVTATPYSSLPPQKPTSMAPEVGQTQAESESFSPDPVIQLLGEISKGLNIAAGCGEDNTECVWPALRTQNILTETGKKPAAEAIPELFTQVTEGSQLPQEDIQDIEAMILAFAKMTGDETDEVLSKEAWDKLNALVIRNQGNPDLIDLTTKIYEGLWAAEVTARGVKPLTTQTVPEKQAPVPGENAGSDIQAAGEPQEDFPSPTPTVVLPTATTTPTATATPTQAPTPNFFSTAETQHKKILATAQAEVTATAKAEDDEAAAKLGRELEEEIQRLTNPSAGGSQIGESVKLTATATATPTLEATESSAAAPTSAESPDTVVTESAATATPKPPDEQPKSFGEIIWHLLFPDVF